MARNLEQQEAYSDAMVTMATKLDFLQAKPIAAIASDTTKDNPTFVIFYHDKTKLTTSFRQMKELVGGVIE